MGEVSFAQLTQLVGTVGFPIAVAWYFMTTFNKTLKDFGEKMGLLVTEIRLYRDGGQIGK